MPVPTRVFLVTVNGTHCCISEPQQDPNTLHFSHKMKKPAIAYKIAVNTIESKVRWISDPSQAGYSDLHIFCKEGGLKEKIPNGKRIIADNGYHSKDAVISAPNPLDTKEAKQFKSCTWAQHDTLYGQIKTHNIVDQHFQSAHNKHQHIFEAVAIFVQYDMDNGMTFFDI
jgi:DDE superfamily endonuclease